MRHRLPTLPMALGVLLLFLTLGVAHADYQANYAAGIRAMDFKDWPAAIRALKAALQEQPAEGGQVLVYGVRPSVYLPHYHLGVAYLNLGDCQAALNEWKASEGQGAVQKAKAEYRALLQYRSQCEGRVAANPKPTPAVTSPSSVAAVLPTPTAKAPPAVATEPPKLAQRLEPTAAARVEAQPTAVPAGEIARARGEAETEIKRAEGAASTLASLRDQPAARSLWMAEPALRGKEEAAGKTLDGARSALAKAKARNDVAGFARAGKMALDASGQFSALRKSFSDRVEQASQRERDARAVAAKELESRRLEARTLLAQVPKSAANAQLRQARNELQSWLARADSASTDSPAAELQKLSEGIAGTIASVRRHARPEPPPPDLLEGAAAYFRGEYTRVAQLLDSRTFADPRAASRARLFLAASRYTSYVLGGEMDSRLREKAAQDVHDCVRLDAAVTLNARAFSPRFREFFRKESGNGSASPK